MGYWKQFSITRDEDEMGNQIANLLGITYHDLYVLGYILHTSDDENGNIEYYHVEFKNGSNHPEILEKIERLSENNTVTFNEYELEDEGDGDYYDYQFESIYHNKYYSHFQDEINNLRKLNKLEIKDDELIKILRRQIYISTIGVLESFLSETFINKTFDDERYLKNFVQTHPEFKRRKFELSDIFQSYEQIKDTSKKIMLDTIYHDLPKVKSMYRSTFDMDFPSIADVVKIIETRHDLVHRNGKTKDGKSIEIDDKKIDYVINTVDEFCSEIAEILDLNDFSADLKKVYDRK